eukprot:6248505-Lingulodinium_polyedra.AAC.1
MEMALGVFWRLMPVLAGRFPEETWVVTELLAISAIAKDLLDQLVWQVLWEHATWVLPPEQTDPLDLLLAGLGEASGNQLQEGLNQGQALGHLATFAPADLLQSGQGEIEEGVAGGVSHRVGGWPSLPRCHCGRMREGFAGQGDPLQRRRHLSGHHLNSLPVEDVGPTVARRQPRPWLLRAERPPFAQSDALECPGEEAGTGHRPQGKPKCLFALEAKDLADGEEAGFPCLVGVLEVGGLVAVGEEVLRSREAHGSGRGESWPGLLTHKTGSIQGRLV